MVDPQPSLEVLHRRKATANLIRDLSEAFMSQGYSPSDAAVRAARWFNNPWPELNGATPQDLLDQGRLSELQLFLDKQLGRA